MVFWNRNSLRNMYSNIFQVVTVTGTRAHTQNLFRWIPSVSLYTLDNFLNKIRNTNLVHPRFFHSRTPTREMCHLSASQLLDTGWAMLSATFNPRQHAYHCCQDSQDPCCPLDLWSQESDETARFAKRTHWDHDDDDDDDDDDDLETPLFAFYNMSKSTGYSIS